MVETQYYRNISLCIKTDVNGNKNNLSMTTLESVLVLKSIDSIFGQTSDDQKVIKDCMNCKTKFFFGKKHIQCQRRMNILESCFGRGSFERMFLKYKKPRPQDQTKIHVDALYDVFILVVVLMIEYYF